MSQPDMFDDVMKKAREITGAPEPDAHWADLLADNPAQADPPAAPEFPIESMPIEAQATLAAGYRDELRLADGQLELDLAPLMRQIDAARAAHAEARALLRDAVAQTLAGNALGVELSKALARITQLEREINGRDERIAELDAEVRETRSEAAGLRAGPEAARVAGWQTVWDLQTKHINTWRDKAEWYWFARFSEEVGELGGALVGNHDGPVEWELSQIAAIALNWLDMRAATERRRNE